MNEILTVQEVANYLKVSRTTVWRWCNQGKLPAFKIGRGWRVRWGEVEKALVESDFITPPQIKFQSEIGANFWFGEH